MSVLCYAFSKDLDQQQQHLLRIISKESKDRSMQATHVAAGRCITNCLRRTYQAQQVGLCQPWLCCFVCSMTRAQIQSHKVLPI